MTLPPRPSKPFENIKQVLRAAGADLKDIVKLTVYLLDGDDREKVADVRAKYLGAVGPPATTVIVKNLALPGLRVEIEPTVVLDLPEGPQGGG